VLTACVGGAISEEECLDGLQKVGLVDVEVMERVVYEYAQINTFPESEELPAASFLPGQ
jgi:hypothetical protein